MACRVAILIVPCRDTGYAASRYWACRFAILIVPHRLSVFLQRYHFNVIVHLLVKNAQPTRIVRPLFLPAALEEDQEQPEDLQTSDISEYDWNEPSAPNAAPTLLMQLALAMTLVRSPLPSKASTMAEASTTMM